MINSATPRPEYPRPQFVRSDWQCLNGIWTYEFDFGRSGAERELYKRNGFENRITVPFCPESELSGVGYTDFIDAVWYHREFTVPAQWRGRRIILHFGAVDYECDVYIDGVAVGGHRGGSVSFSVDITKVVEPGTVHHLVVHARDEVRSGEQPVGKQSVKFRSQGCRYTRVTGIWQSVWLEPVAYEGISSCRIQPDFDGRRFVFTPEFFQETGGVGLRIRLSGPSGEETVGEFAAVSGVPVVLDVADFRPWSPEDPFLYAIVLEVVRPEGETVDLLQSYGGMRKTHLEGDRIFLNNEPVYLRFVLDQGYYPGGIWTAPSDEALKRDIQLSLEAGFNGARLHQKVFEERFHYWADKMGYLTWAESANWGMEPGNPEAAYSFVTEWSEIVARDRNHPSIIAWTPFNEVGHRGALEHHRRLMRDTYRITRLLDPTRPVNDCSGWVHVKTDLWTVHDYEQDAEKLLPKLSETDPDTILRNFGQICARYEGQPFVLDEFGGIKWNLNVGLDSRDTSWGYGKGPRTLDEFLTRLKSLVEAVVSVEHIRGYCYTQLTDVEQEQNGIYTYRREKKFDPEVIRGIFSMSPRDRRP